MGRADSMAGQSASAADIDGPSDGWHVKGSAASPTLKRFARQVASHHARAGAAAPTRSATIRIGERFTSSV